MDVFDLRVAMGGVGGFAGCEYVSGKRCSVSPSSDRLVSPVLVLNLVALGGSDDGADLESLIREWLRMGGWLRLLELEGLNVTGGGAGAGMGCCGGGTASDWDWEETDFDKVADGFARCWLRPCASCFPALDPGRARRGGGGCEAGTGAGEG
jgi:hypothetical protein